LQELHQAHVRAEVALGGSDEEKGRVMREVAALAQQLGEDRQELERVAAANNSLEVCVRKRGGERVWVKGGVAGSNLFPSGRDLNQPEFESF
jgi:hypothetical protein